MDPKFGLTSPILNALFYLPPGLGYLVGSLFGGRLANYTVKKYIKIRGRRVPEDRLRSTLIPIGMVYPACMHIYGWSVEKEKGGIAVPVIFMLSVKLHKPVYSQLQILTVWIRCLNWEVMVLEAATSLVTLQQPSHLRHASEALTI
mgnify:CR=1 FL=1